MTSLPPSKVDAMVAPCVKRCLARETPLIALAEILDVLGLDPTWTVFEIAELRRRVVEAFLEEGLGDDPPYRPMHPR